MPTLLCCLLVLPLASAVVVALLGPRQGPAIRWISLACTLVCLVLAIIVSVHFISLSEQRGQPVPGDGLTFQPEMVPGDPGDRHTTTWTLVPVGATGAGIQFFIGIDGLNIWLVALTALLLVPSVLISWTAIQERVHEYYAWLLVLETGMLGVFLAFDIILFYVFFELTLVPLFFLIGIWGGPERQYAARKFFIFTLAGSLITLLGVLGIVLTLALGGEQRLTFSIPELVSQVDRQTRDLDRRVHEAGDRLQGALKKGDGSAAEEQQGLQAAQDALAFWRRVQFWVFAAMMVGFAIKVPLVPVHTWLPLAHTEAPTAGSVLLAGVLLKIGSYGFLRLCVPLAPEGALSLGVPLITTVAVIGILYGAFCALAQPDIKKLVAYSSVSHLGYCMLGMFVLTEPGLNGSLLQMINHGLSTGALFLLVGMLYERYHTRKMADYGGMGARLHLLAVFWVFITLSSIGLPGLNGFVGEFLVLAGTYSLGREEVNGILLGTLASGGVILGAWYMLTLTRQVFFGPVREPHHEVHGEGHGPSGDLNIRELAALVPIAIMCVWLGVYPRTFLNPSSRDLGVVAQIADQARQRKSAEAALASRFAPGGALVLESPPSR